MILFFYYGLLFLGTLCISDGVATFLVLCLVDFLLLKAIWEDYKPFVSWRNKKYKQLIKLKKLVKKPLLKKWGKAPLLKRAYIIVAGIVGFALLILFVRLYLEILLFEWDITKTTRNADSSIRNLAIAFLGTTSSIGALFGFFLAILRSEENKRQNDVAEKQSKTALAQSKIANTQSEIANKQAETANKQAETAEQGLITDRISKAVDGLSKINQKDKPVIEARFGALYALERIAKDSERDHVQIIEIICAYIRTNSSNDNKEIITNPLREDIREALTIIGRRETWSKDKSRLQIEKTQGMHLNFFNCYLKGAELYDTDLSGANFYKANLQHAWLSGANLTNARILDMDISSATLTDVKTNGAHAPIGDFSGCQTLTQKQLDVMYCGIEVKIPDGLTRPDHWPKVELSYDDFMEAYDEWRKTQP